MAKKELKMTPLTDDEQAIFEKLNKEQRQFLIEYERLGGKGHQTEAYLAVYGAKKEMKYRTAVAAASRLLANVNLKPIITAINRKINDVVVDNSIMGMVEAKQRLAKYARREPIEKMKSDGTIYEGLPSVKESLKSLEMIIRIEGGFNDKQQVELSGGLPVFIRDDIDE